MLNPEPNVVTLRSNAEVTHFENVDVDGRRDEFKLTKYELSLRYMMHQTESSEWFTGVDFKYFDVDTSARLPRTLQAIPDDLYDVSLGLGYRRFLENDKLAGGFFRIGSASDKLFDSTDELYLKGTAFLEVRPNRIPWIFLLHVNTDLDFPVIPGIGILFATHDQRFKGAVGIPFLALTGNLTDRWDLQLSYVPVNNVHAELGYKPWERVRASVSYDWRSTYFRRADRPDEDDRLEFEEMRASAGIDVTITENVWGSLLGGYAFERSVGEGEDNDDRDRNDLEIEDGWFGRVEFRMNW